VLAGYHQVEALAAAVLHLEAWDACAGAVLCCKLMDGVCVIEQCTDTAGNHHTLQCALYVVRVAEGMAHVLSFGFVLCARDRGDCDQSCFGLTCELSEGRPADVEE
jgi:hypothetical protein